MPARRRRRLLALALGAATALCAGAGVAPATPARATRAPHTDAIRKSTPIAVIARAHWIRSGPTSATTGSAKR